MNGEIAESDLEPSERVVLASGYLRLQGDDARARLVLGGVEQPDQVADTTVGVNDSWAPFHYRFSLNRLLGALGDQRPLHEIVPDVPPDAPARSTRSAAGVAHIGRLAGWDWIGTRLTPSEFEAHARPLVRLFPDHPQLLRGSYVALRARAAFYTRLIQLASVHGSDCVAVLQQLFESEWADDSRRDTWPDSLVRTMLTELLGIGAPMEWARMWLARIEPATFRGEDLDSELSDGVDQARAWAAAGDIIAARTTVELRQRGKG